MISCEDKGTGYLVKWEGDTEEILSEVCAVIASLCKELEANPIDAIYDITMNMLMVNPGGKEQALTLAGWLQESADELEVDEGVTS